jgi:hypothetical protein
VELHANNIADYVVHAYSFFGQDAEEERERLIYLLRNFVELYHQHNENFEKDIH